MNISPSTPARKKIYIANTGGTIGMRRSSQGYRPQPGYLADLMAQMPSLQRKALPRYDIVDYDPLIDSSNMRPADWSVMAHDIAARYGDYDGFVILHGTDTMAYTASALSYLLAGLAKPVVLTGSQIPLCEVRNDARENLMAALLVAARPDLAEVVLVFGDRLLRGNRSVKVDADGFNAFASPNFPPLGKIGVHIQIDVSHLQSRPPKPTGLSIPDLKPAQVGAFKLFPGISHQAVTHYLQEPLQGIVLQTYGSGNAPNNYPELHRALAKAAQRGVVVVNCTQCVSGAVRMGSYATGRALASLGVISGQDMTFEAAITKLSYLLGKELSMSEIQAQLQTDLRGELTPLRENSSE